MEKLELLKHTAAVTLSRAADLRLITLLDEKPFLDFMSLATLIECKLDDDPQASELDQALEKELPALLHAEIVKRWRAIKENKQIISGEVSETIPR